MRSHQSTSLRHRWLLSAAVLALAVTTSGHASVIDEAVDAVIPVDSLDYHGDPSAEPPVVVEVPDEPPTEAVDDKLVDAATDTGTDAATDAATDTATDDPTDVPIEWVQRGTEPEVMYSMTDSGSVEDNADDVAAHAAEQTANRTLDQIDALGQIDAAQAAAAPLN